MGVGWGGGGERTKKRTKITCDVKFLGNGLLGMYPE